MTSTSGIGSLSITLQFDLARSIDAAAQDVLTAINAATGVLPKDLPSPPTYRKTNPADRPVLIYAVHSNALPIYRVDDYAYTILAQKISTVKGVSEARIFGQRPYATHVQVNPGALSARGLGFEDVRNALALTSINRPKGTLEGTRQTSCSTPTVIATSLLPIATARRCGWATSRRWSTACRTRGSALGTSTHPAKAWRSSARPGPTSSSWSTPLRR
jgi:multidrug efflux pump subunit AcrB